MKFSDSQIKLLISIVPALVTDIFTTFFLNKFGSLRRKNEIDPRKNKSNVIYLWRFDFLYFTDKIVNLYSSANTIFTVFFI